MCLIKYYPGFNIAKNDIHVYKMLEKRSCSSKKKYYAPYHEYRYTPGIEEGILKLEEKVYKHLLSDEILYCVYDGFHAWTDYCEAAYSCRDENQFIFDAIIPAGSQYATGINSDIVSNRIKIIKDSEVNMNEIIKKKISEGNTRLTSAENNYIHSNYKRAESNTKVVGYVCALKVAIGNMVDTILM